MFCNSLTCYRSWFRSARLWWARCGARATLPLECHALVSEKQYGRSLEKEEMTSKIKLNCLFTSSFLNHNISLKTTYFLLHILNIYFHSIYLLVLKGFLPVKILWKAVSTLVQSRADVSMKERLWRSAKTVASSVGTERKCLKSDLFPTCNAGKECSSHQNAASF